MENKTKLNKLERLKKTLKPTDFNINSCHFDSLSEDDRFYLKNYGIYNIKLAPSKFMLRIRGDNSFTSCKLKELILVVKKYNLELVITARAGLEIHNISKDLILELYNIVNLIGFKTSGSLTDNVRAIVTDPYDSIAQDSYIDSLEIVKQIQKQLANNSKYLGLLPRKFNTAIIGKLTPHINPWGNDLLFALAKNNDTYGFNIYLGGKNSETAKCANIFVEAKDTKRLFFAILDSFLELGLRGSRSKTRLYYLLETIGISKFREQVELNFGKKLQTSQKLLMQSSKFRAFTKLKSGKYGKVYECNYGKINLDRALDILSKESNIRIGADQNLHILNVEKESTKPSSSIVACVGAKYCPLSLWNIKDDIAKLNLAQFKELGINVGFSGCLKGCGRHQHSHIGLVGLRSNMFGKTQRALRVFIGSCEVPKPTPARLLYYAVPESKVDGLFKAIINDYKFGNYSSFNQYNSYLNSYDIEVLQLWFILKQLVNIDSKINTLFHTPNRQQELLSALQALKIYPQKANLYENINTLSHLLWDS
jgi:ferredoxin-nitrite reductase